MEEKAKAYEKALERAREWYDSDVPGSYGCIIENIFPELKKSESERISEEIVEYLYNDLNNIKQLTPRTNQFESWLNWLKKQGKQDKM